MEASFLWTDTRKNGLFRFVRHAWCNGQDPEKALHEWVSELPHPAPTVDDTRIQYAMVREARLTERRKSTPDEIEDLIVACKIREPQYSLRSEFFEETGRFFGRSGKAMEQFYRAHIMRPGLYLMPERNYKGQGVSTAAERMQRRRDERLRRQNRVVADAPRTETEVYRGVNEDAKDMVTIAAELERANRALGRAAQDREELVKTFEKRLETFDGMIGQIKQSREVLRRRMIQLLSGEEPTPRAQERVEEERA